MKETFARIQRMDRCFAELQQAFFEAPESIRCNSELCESKEMLTDYLESGLWLRDYTRDENGQLPKDLPRGVLSQDGLYDLLQAITAWEREHHDDL